MKIFNVLATVNTMSNQGIGIFDVLKQIIHFIITKNGMREFSEKDIRDLLKKEFYFENIPFALIRESLFGIEGLSRIPNKSADFIFRIQDSSKFDIHGIQQIIAQKQREQNELLEEMYTFCLTGINKNNKKEKEQISKSFIEYLREGEISNPRYLPKITSFVIQHASTPILQELQSTLIMYDGLTYPNFYIHTSQAKQKSKVLKIYLNVEVVFHMAGYNDPFFQDHFNDLYEVIQEINQVSELKIKLKISSNEFERIERFFDEAVDILNRGKKLDPKNRDAMDCILSSCNHEWQIRDKFSKLKSLIKSKNIEIEAVENNNLYKEENYQYHLISNIDIEDKFDNDEEKNRVITTLAFVASKRKNPSVSYLEDAKVIFLTEFKEMLLLSKEIKNIHNMGIPLAINIHQLLRTLWLKLGKGFSQKTDYPIPLQAVSNAKIALASLENKNIIKIKNEIRDIYTTKSKAEEEIGEILLSFGFHRRQIREIDEKTINLVIENIDLDIEKIEQKAKSEKEKKEDEIALLTTKNANLERENHQHKQKEKLRQKQSIKNRRSHHLLKIKNISKRNHFFRNTIHFFVFLSLIIVFCFFFTFMITLSSISITFLSFFGISFKSIKRVYLSLLEKYLPIHKKRILTLEQKNKNLSIEIEKML